MPMPKPKNLVKFNTLAGVPCYYAAVNAAYGDPSKCKKSWTRELAPAFLRDLEATIQEIAWLTRPYLGELVAITSGGAWVDKPGAHSKGQAYDLGGLHWNNTKLVVFEEAKDYNLDPPPSTYLIYLAVEAVIRKHFGTVLGIHYNAAHHNHWHIQYGTDVGFWQIGFGAETRIRFLKEISKHVWGIDMPMDDKKVTQKKLAELQAAAGVGKIYEQIAWLQLLTLTAMRAMSLHARFI